MHYFYVAPLLCEILRDKSPVTLLGGRLAAEKNGRLIEQRLIDYVLDLSLLDKLIEKRFKFRPFDFFMMVIVENLLARGQARLMEIIGVDNFPEEKPEIVALGERRHLGDIVQADVDQEFYTGFFEDSEEFLGGFL